MGNNYDAYSDQIVVGKLLYVLSKKLYDANAQFESRILGYYSVSTWANTFFKRKIVVF